MHSTNLYIPKRHKINDKLARLREQQTYNFVFFGGGTGLSTIVAGAKPFYPSPIKEISAVVAVSDNGGSTGRIRNAYRIPAPGDVRKLLVSLSVQDDILKALFKYRFSNNSLFADSNNSELWGHSLGNLILTALTDITGTFAKAVEEASKLLNTVGKVLPVTLAPVDLVAKFDNGKIIKGEVQIYTYGKKQKGKITDIWLEPKEVDINPQVIASVKQADIIVIGPGSLYTSVIASVLHPKIRQAFRTARALVIYICNLMTDFGETHRMSAFDHFQTIDNVLGGSTVDITFINSETIPSAIQKKYQEVQGSIPVEPDIDRFIKHNVPYLLGDFLQTDANAVRHDATKVISRVLQLVSPSGA